MPHVNVSAILGCFIFAMFLLWVLAEVAYVSAKLRAIFSAILSEPPCQTGVDAMLDQMYAGGPGTEYEYHKTRHAHKAPTKKGGKHGKG